MIILSYFHATVADLIVVIAIIVIINMDINDYKRHRNQEKQWLRTYQMCVTDGLTFCSSSSALPCRSSNLSPRSKTLSMLSFTTSFNSSTCWFIVSIVCLSDISFFCGVGLKLFHQLLAITLRDMYVIKPKSQVSLRTPCNMKNFKYIWNRKSWMINCSTSNDRGISRGANSRFKRCMYMQL